MLVSLSPVFAFGFYFKYNELKLTFNFLFSCIVIHPSSRSIALNLYHLNFLNFCTCRTSLHFIVLALSDRQTVPQGGCSSVRHSKSYSFRSKQVYLRPISVSFVFLVFKVIVADIQIVGCFIKGCHLVVFFLLIFSSTFAASSVLFISFVAFFWESSPPFSSLFFSNLSHLFLPVSSFLPANQVFLFDLWWTRLQSLESFSQEDICTAHGSQCILLQAGPPPQLMISHLQAMMSKRRRSLSSNAFASFPWRLFLFAVLLCWCKRWIFSSMAFSGMSESLQMFIDEGISHCCNVAQASFSSGLDVQMHHFFLQISFNRCNYLSSQALCFGCPDASFLSKSVSTDYLFTGWKSSNIQQLCRCSQITRLLLSFSFYF